MEKGTRIINMENGYLEVLDLPIIQYAGGRGEAHENATNNPRDNWDQVVQAADTDLVMEEIQFCRNQRHRFFNERLANYDSVMKMTGLFFSCSTKIRSLIHARRDHLIAEWKRDLNL